MENQRDRIYLIKEMAKKINTATIGSLSKFELFFGIIWGHGKQEHELDDSEKEWRRIWMECRNEILDNGNNQARLAQQILNTYSVEQQKQVTEIGKYDENNKFVYTKHPIIKQK